MKALLKIICVLSLMSVQTLAQEKGIEKQLQHSDFAPVPKGLGKIAQKGLAFAFGGNVEGVVWYAGGCNFPKQRNGELGDKKYYKDVFAYGLNGKNSWELVGQLPQGMAYGASVALPEGLLCIGGKNNSTGLSSKTFLMHYNKERKELNFDEFPDLPFAMSQIAATVLDNMIYVVGGELKNGISNVFLRLDLTKKGVENWTWEKLKPYPEAVRLQPVVVAQNAEEEKHLYVFSGSSYSPNKALPDVMSNALEYNPKTNKWKKLEAIQAENKVFSLHGGVGVPVGKQFILCTGGVNKDVFFQALQKIREGSEAKKQGDSLAYRHFLDWKKQYLSKPQEWYRFNKEVLAFNTITKRWAVINKHERFSRAGATLVPWKKGWLLLNGELKPGVRTPTVSYFKLVSESQFGWVNWLVLTAYLVGMLLLGFYFMAKKRNSKDFFTGGGRIPWWAAGISIFATMLSAITFMAIPAKVYATNWKYFPMVITILIMVFPVVKYYLPFFRRLKVTTAYEYLEVRFNEKTRFLASFLFIVFMVARMALVLFLPSLALTTVTGIDIYTCITLMGVITIIYCTMGGVEAVVWGDVVQGIVLFGGALLAVFYLVSGVEGGWNTVMEVSVNQNKWEMLNWAFDWKNATVWVVVLGGLANNLISYSSDQTVIQRYMTTKDEKAASQSILLNGILSVVVSVVFYFIGTALYAYYFTKPEAMNFTMYNTDAIFPQFIMAEMPVGLAGLLIAAIFAATMSTVSSNVNSISTAFTSDFYMKFFPHTNDKKELRVARWSGIIFGGVGLIIALLMATWNILSLFDYFNYILGLLASGLGGLFAMGIFFPRIGGRSALIGFFSGVILLIFISLKTEVSFLLFGFIGIISSVLVALIFSFILPENHKNIEGLTWESLRKRKENN